MGTIARKLAIVVTIYKAMLSKLAAGKKVEHCQNTNKL